MATIDELCSKLSRLDETQLQAVSEFIALLLYEDDEELDEPEPESQDSDKSDGARGYVELKLIRGYGPYAYLRWRSGGRLRSKYLGKVKPS